MPRATRSRTNLLSTLACMLLVSSSQSGSHPATEAALAAGASGWPASLAKSDEPAGPLRTPSGRWILAGERDELGYVLPLDVQRPRTSLAAKDAPTPLEILLRRAEAPTGLFPETRLGPDDGHTQNETSIDADGGVLVAGWNNYTDTSLVMGAARSTDGGASWEWQLLGDHSVMSDPAVQASGLGDGRWYYGYIASGGPGGSDWEVFVRRSLDDGASWQAPVQVTVDTDFDDKPYIAARGDEVLVGYADFGFSPAKVRAARSLDGGLTFGNDTVLAVVSGNGNGANTLIDAAGDYYVLWRDSFQEFLWMSRSEDQGASWSADSPVVAMTPLPSTLPGGFRIVNLPSAASPAPGHLVVVWNDQLLGDPDVLCVRSLDGGDTWSSPIRVNDDAGTTDQFFPWITADDAGGLHVVWYDRRENGFDIDVYTSYSGDGGATFEPNVRVTAAAFTPVLPWDVGLDFIGDYNGIAADGGNLYPFYQDAREGNQDVYVAVLPAPGTIFSDGFESGDTSAWSSSVP